jgi:RNA polymerase sigma-70 factor (ECF subfamily)
LQDATGGAATASNHEDGGRVKAEQDALDVRRVLAGETAAFEAIVRRWQGPLVNLAYRFCRDRGRAEEMAQEAFLKVFSNLSTWRGEAAFSTWMFATAINLYRSSLRRVTPPGVSLDAAAGLADPRTGHGLFEDEDRREAVRRAVGALPHRYRDAITLFYFLEMDVEAAARALRLPEGTVKARLHRGRGMLRRRLAEMLRAPSKGAQA